MAGSNGSSGIAVVVAVSTAPSVSKMVSGRASAGSFADFVHQ
jgi:hypothetical protein